MIRVLAIASLLLLAAPGASQAHGETTRELCDRRGGSTMEQVQCFAGSRVAEDARLNRIYRALMARLKPAQRLALRDEQRAWIKDRDAECMPFYDETQYGRQGKVDGEECIAVGDAVEEELKAMAHMSAAQLKTQRAERFYAIGRAGLQ